MYIQVISFLCANGFTKLRNRKISPLQTWLYTPGKCYPVWHNYKACSDTYTKCQTSSRLSFSATRGKYLKGPILMRNYNTIGCRLGKCCCAVWQKGLECQYGFTRTHTELQYQFAERITLHYMSTYSSCRLHCKASIVLQLCTCTPRQHSVLIALQRLELKLSCKFTGAGGHPVSGCSST